MKKHKSIRNIIEKELKEQQTQQTKSLETNEIEISEGIEEIFIITKVIQTTKNSEKCVILTIVASSVVDEKYVEITGNWVEETRFSIGAIISVHQEFELYTFLPFINNKSTAIISNDSGSFTLYPSYLIRVKSIAASFNCLRKGYLAETTFYGEVTSKSVLSTLTQICLSNFIKNPNHSIINIIDNAIHDNKNLVYIAGENETTVRKKLIKQLNPLKKIKPPFPSFVIPFTFDNRPVRTQMFPKVFSPDKNTHQTFKSFKLGLTGTPNTLLITEDNPQKLIPLDIITKDFHQETFSENSAITTGNVELLKERFTSSQVDDSGFIWYIHKKDDQRFFVFPSQLERTTLYIKRNSVAAFVAENKIPSKSYSRDCDYCKYRKMCDLVSRMELKDAYSGDLSTRIPGRLEFYSTSKETDFFWHFHDLLSIEARKEMDCCTNISLIPLKQRVQQRIAIQKLFVKQIIKDSGSVIFEYRGPMSLYAFHLRNHDNVIITNNGSFPIIGSGIVTDIKYNIMTVYMKDISLNESQEVTFDVFEWSGAHRLKSAALYSLFLRQTSERLKVKELLVDGVQPQFSDQYLEFMDHSLNLWQKEAAKLALSAKDYCLIQAPPGSGATFLITRIVEAHVRKGHRVLIAPYYYKTINKIARELSTLSIKFIISSMPEFIDAKFKQYCDSAIFETSTDIEECDRRMSLDAQVYIVQSKRKSKLIEQMDFDVCIAMDASIDDVLLLVPQLIVADSFILVGDPLLDNTKDSAFNHFAKNSPDAIVKLNEVYGTEPAIVELRRLIWGDIVTFAGHASVDLKPIQQLPIEIQSIMSKILSMDYPVVFIDTKEPIYAVYVAICAGILYERVILSAGELFMPQFTQSINVCIQLAKNPAYVIPDYISHPVSNVKPLRLPAIRAERNDVCVFYADGQTDPLTHALAMTKRKLILIADVHTIGSNPLWASVIHQLPQEAKFSSDNIPFSEPYLILKSAFNDIEYQSADQ